MVSRFFAKTLTIIFCLTSPIHAGDLSVSIKLIPQATYTIKELYTVYKNDKLKDNISSITLSNSGNTNYQIKVRLRILSKNLGNKAVFESISNPTNFNITVAARSSTVISHKDIQYKLLQNSQLVEPQNNLLTRFKTIYSNTRLRTLKSVSEDEYSFEVYVFDKKETDSAIKNFTRVLASDKNSVSIPLEFGSIDLISPKQDDTLSPSILSPVFSWTPVSVKDSVDVVYKILIWKVLNEDIESSINLRPLVEKKVTTITKLSYPTQAEALKLNQEYVWRVEAYEPTGSPIGLIGSSKEQSFKFGSTAAPSLLNSNMIITSFPANLAWKSNKKNTPFTIVISEHSNLSAPLIKETSHTNSFELPNSDKFYPGSSYYWTVYANMGKENEERSTIGTFKIQSEIHLLSPIGDTLGSDKINLYWTGSKNYRYSVQVAGDVLFKQPKNFIVEGVELSLEDYADFFEPGQPYYWRVAALNKQSELASQYSKPASFNIKKSDKTLLIYPVSETVSKPTIRFTFQESSLAKSYRFTLRSAQSPNTILYQKDCQKSPLILDMTSLGQIPNLSHYTWQLEGLDDNGKTIEKSLPATFFYLIEQSIPLYSYPQYFNSNTPFTWSPIPQTDVYIIRFSPQATFKEVKEFKVKAEHFELTKELKKYSNLFFVIRAFNKELQLLAESEVKQLLSPTFKAKTADIIYVSPSNAVDSKKAWHFYWLGSEDSYEIEIATNKTFIGSKRFKTQSNKLDPTTIAYEFLLNKHYYWRINGSPNFSTFVLRQSDIRQIHPISKTVNTAPIRFEWMGSLGNHYQIIVSTQENLSNPLIYSCSNTFYNLNLTTNGRYFWRVEQLNSEGRVIQRSAVSSFTYFNDYQSLTAKTLSDLNAFIKKQLPADSPLQESTWVLESIETKDGKIISEIDIKELIKHPERVKKVVE